MALAIPHTSLQLLSLLMSLGRCTIYQVLAAEFTTSRTEFRFAVFPFEPNTRHHIIIQSATPSPASPHHINSLCSVFFFWCILYHVRYSVPIFPYWQSHNVHARGVKCAAMLTQLPKTRAGLPSCCLFIRV